MQIPAPPAFTSLRHCVISPSELSLGLDSGRLRHFRPFLRFGLEEGGVLVRPFAGDLVAERLHLPAKLRVTERLGEYSVDAVDDRARCAGWREQAVPVVARESLEPLFLRGWRVGQQGRARGRSDRQAAQLAAPHVGRRLKDLDLGEVYVAREQ